MASVVRTAGRILLGLTGLLVVAILALYFVGSSRLAAEYSTEVESLSIPSDSASIEAGRYLAATHGCMACHTPDLSGQVVVDAPPFRMVASNLTPGTGGVGSHYSGTDYVRAIRYGVRPDGSGLFMMPTTVYWAFSDVELANLVAYLQSLDGVDNELPTSEFKPLGKIIAAVDKTFKAEAAMIDRSRSRPVMPERGPTAEWGNYRVQTSCIHCHGADLHGGKSPDPESPPALPLDSVKGWTLAQFVHAIRTGETPDGRNLDARYMPWEEFAHMTDDDLTAIYLKLQEI